MSLDEPSTTEIEADGRSTQIDIAEVEETIGGDWRRIEETDAFECDFGYGMCSIRLEFEETGWVAKLASVNPPVLREIQPRPNLNGALAGLRGLLREHALRLKERGERLMELALGEVDSDD